MNKIRVAFIKYNGLGAGGTERWLQGVATLLPKNAFEVCYFYTGEEDPFRKAWLEEHEVRLVRIASSSRGPAGEWLETDLFEKFDEQQFDIIQTATAGPSEWPYFCFQKPVVQKIALNMGADLRSNVPHTFFLSHWLRRQWMLKGGSLLFSSVVPFGVMPVVCDDNVRDELGIPKTALVAGFHQRIDDDTFSPVPLKAFGRVGQADQYFIIMGGSPRYAIQAAELGLANFRHVPHSGDLARISSFLNTLDIFAQGRRDGETFGYVFAEALMHGKPCLGHAAECNAHKETMGPGGLWATTQEEYAAHLRRLFADEALRQALATAGRRHAHTLFDNDKGIAAIAKVYREVHAMPGWKWTLIALSRAIRLALRHLGVYELITLGFRARRKSLHLRGKLY